MACSAAPVTTPRMPPPSTTSPTLCPSRRAARRAALPQPRAYHLQRRVLRARRLRRARRRPSGAPPPHPARQRQDRVRRPAGVPLPRGARVRRVCTAAPRRSTLGGERGGVVLPAPRQEAVLPRRLHQALHARHPRVSTRSVCPTSAHAAPGRRAALCALCAGLGLQARPPCDTAGAGQTKVN